MSRPSPLTALHARIVSAGLPRRTVRLRLTLLYGALFLVSGAALLSVTYVLVLNASTVSVAGSSSAHDAEGARRSPAEHAAPVPPPDGPDGRLVTDVLPTAAQEIMEQQRAAVLDDLLVQSAFALALMSVISIALGWVVSGRILRPLRTITSTVRDITATSLHRRLALDGPGDELKELGDTFDGLLGRLESSFDAQRRFIANASHELRTPLARQRTLGQVALADPDADAATLREAHERILAAGAQQERLIEALLMLARGNAGIEVHQPFDLGVLADEVVDARRLEATVREVSVSCAAAPAVASGHRPLAERLVVNLVDNALRHNMPGGWVEVTTGDTTGRAVLTVANSGPAVPPEAVDRLFQPFQRLGASRAGAAEGLGLGLSIVRAIATAHGATVTAEARPEGGLVFTVVFPAPPREPARPAVRAQQAPR